MIRYPKCRKPGLSWSFFLILLCLICPLALLGLANVQSNNHKPLSPQSTTLESSDVVIGIDLGITHSCVGVMVDGKVEILANEQGNRITPSYVAFNDEERLVGDAAKNQSAANPSRTIFDFK